MDPVTGVGTQSTQAANVESPGRAAHAAEPASSTDGEPRALRDAPTEPEQGSAPAEFACLRGEPCTRIAGGKCPGGVGC